jgi:hypothetical protein
MTRCLLLVVVLAVCGCTIPPIPGQSPVGPVTPVAQPSAEMQRIMGELQRVMAGKPQAAEFGADWRDLHAVVQSGSIKLDSNQRLRNVIDRFSLLLITQRYSATAFPGFTEVLNRAMYDAFTDENTPIDPNKAADFILGIAWACGG